MSIPEVAGVVCWCVMGTTCLGLRRRRHAFNVICLLLLAGTAAVTGYASDVRSRDALVMLTGLALFWMGLAMVRAMARRSVSVSMLIAYSGDGDVRFRERIASRVDDALKCRLIASGEGGYVLSRAGRVLGWWLDLAYRLAGPAA